MRATGQYYDGRSSRAQSAELETVGAGRVRLRTPGGERVHALAELEISARVGGTPRHIGFPDGAKFETGDNDAIDSMLVARGAARRARLAHMLESRWRYALAAVLAVAAIAWGVYRYGIPAAAKAAAFALPAETSQSIGQGTLELLDRLVLGPSNLDAATQARLRERFARIAAEEPGLRLALEFRKGQRIGANALALPAGTVVLTDELVRLARHDDELATVLAHEVGHVVERHALRRALQGSAVALGAILITGDLSGAAAVVAALPTVLIELQYSQAFELESDRYALAWARRAGIDPAHFGRLMRRMEASRRREIEVPDWLSTHPATEERIRRFEHGAGK